MTDDDKQVPEPDPWAGLDVDGPTSQQDDSPFVFDAVEEVAHNAGLPVIEPPFAALEASADVTADVVAAPQSAATDSPNDIPLIVFPPPDADTASAEAEPPESEILVGAGRSDILSMVDAVADFEDEAFSDQDITRELLAMNEEDESLTENELHDLGLGPADNESSEFAEHPAENASEDSSEDNPFDADPLVVGSPFADGGLDDPFAMLQESSVEEPVSIPIHPVLTTAGAAAITATAGPAARKKGGGVGQMVGVVLGGLMAIPITGLILLGLIWGLQWDQFKSLSKMYPSVVLPARFQPGFKKTTPANKGPSLDQSTGLDDLATLAGSAADQQPSEAGTEPDDPAMQADSTAPAGEEEGTESSATPETLASTSSLPAAMSASGLVALPMTPSTPLTPMTPMTDAIGIDPLPGLKPEPPTEAAEPVVIVPALPPLDFSGVESAVDHAAQAFDAVEDVSDPDDPLRKRLLVAWYKQLAKIGEELAMLETIAADSGRPLGQTPAAVVAFYDRMCQSEAALDDLDRLGGMWITSQKRQADGIVLLATVEATRQVGPYWCTQGAVARANRDGTDRTISIISRMAPPADTGDRVLITGVIFDGAAVWAADVRPAEAGQPADDALPLDAPAGLDGAEVGSGKPAAGF